MKKSLTLIAIFAALCTTSALHAAEKPNVAKGHDFSRAATGLESMWASAPEGPSLSISPEVRSFSAASPAQNSPKPDPWKQAGADTSLKKAFEKAIYTLKDSGHGTWSGSNDAQRLSMEFDAHEARLTHPDGSVGFHLNGYGYGDKLNTPAAPKLASDGSRLEYRRGDFTEWYVNGRQGLEQGFTLAHKPAGASKGQPLTIALGVTGSLALSQQDGAVLLKSGKSTVLRYGGLSARDALGRAIPARMEARNNEIRLVVEDQQAQYPLTVDPTWSLEQELVGSDGAFGDLFGNSVAISGTTAIIGAVGHAVGSNSEQGMAYVFVQNRDTWTLQQELTASDGAAGDWFGYSVAVSGTTAVIGAAEKMIGGNIAEGAAYVFEQSGGAWAQRQELTAADGASHEYFGSVVAVSGTTAVIGAPLRFVAGDRGPGLAYVFEQSGGKWTQQAELTAPNAAANDQFGASIAVSGTTAMIGAFGLDPVYVFQQNGTAWPLQQELNAGTTVSMSGTTALIGNDGGPASIFVQDGTTWTKQQELIASDGVPDDRFGLSVALSGTTAVVGAPGKTVGANSAQGAAYVFVRSGTTWSQQAELTASDGASLDYFGNFVAVSGTTAVIGAYQKTVGGQAAQGAAYIFAPTASPLVAASMLTPTPGIGLPGTSVTFTWLPGVGATEYALWLGTTGVGSSDLYVQSGTTATSQAVTSLPAHGGGTIYARLLTEINGAWQSNDYTYAEWMHPPMMISPAPGSTLTSQSATFTWTGASSPNEGYWLFLGTQGVGSENLYDSHQQAATSATFSNLPTDGATIYARVYTRYNGVFAYNDYTYTAWTKVPATTVPVMTSPAPGSTLSGTSATFTWTAVSSDNEGYWLFLGTQGVGSHDLYDSHQQAATSATFSGLPTNGKTIYARIYTRYNGVFVYNDYTYTAWRQPATLTSPTPGSTLPGASATFTWTAEPSAKGYWLFLGTTGPGSKNLFDSNEQTATSATFNSLPTNGVTIYARVYTSYNGVLVYNDYTYTVQ